MAFAAVLHADPYRWGEGKCHILQGGKTRCGRSPEQCPGRVQVVALDEVLSHITCKTCAKGCEIELKPARVCEWCHRALTPGSACEHATEIELHDGDHAHFFHATCCESSREVEFQIGDVSWIDADFPNGAGEWISVQLDPVDHFCAGYKGEFGLDVDHVAAETGALRDEERKVWRRG